MRFAKDGSSVRTLFVSEQILSDAGVRSAGIVSLPFAALTQRLTFDSVRVRKSSGQVIETPPDDAQEVPLPVTQEAPMYGDLRTKQLPVKSLSVGDTLEYRLTLKDTNAAAPGRLWYAMGFTTGVPVKEETLEVRTPREMSLLVKCEKVQPVVTEEGNERVYRWKQHETASEYPKKDEKDKTAPVNLVQEMYEPDVAMTSFHSWAELGVWYRDGAIRAKADELTRGLTTDDVKVDALYNYCDCAMRRSWSRMAGASKTLKFWSAKERDARERAVAAPHISEAGCRGDRRRIADGRVARTG